MVISIFFIQISSALEFSLSSPSSAELNSEFSASISANTTEVYDVKIFIQDANENILSEIYNNGWKNPHYYLKSSFPAQTEFKLRAINSSGEQEICARLRKTGKTAFDEQCNKILLMPSTAPSPKESSSPIPSSSSEKEGAKEEIKAEETENLQDEPAKEKAQPAPVVSQISAINQTQISYQPKAEKSPGNEKIILNPIQNKSEEPEIFSTKNEFIRNAVIYSFVGFCVILIVLLSLRQL